MEKISWRDTTKGILFHFFTIAKALETIVLRLKITEFGKELLFHILSENGPNLGKLSFNCPVNVQLTEEEIKTFMELISKLKSLRATYIFLCDSVPSTINKS